MRTGLLALVALMCAWDFALHLGETLFGQQRAHRAYFKLGFPFAFKNRRTWSVFFTVYWGVALLLVLAAIVA